MKTKTVKTSGGKSFLLLTEGALSVKIYTSAQTKNGVEYLTHQVCYSEAGKRIRKGFGNMDRAKDWAQQVLTRLSNGETEIKGLSAVDLQDLNLAKQALEGLNVSVSSVAQEYRKAMELLASKGTINDAVRFFVSNANPDLPKKNVGEVITELCEAKRKDKLSVRYVGDLKLRLTKFSKAFPGEIAQIRTAEIETWLRELKAGPKSRNNYAACITTLFSFAKRCGYLAQDRATVAENLSRAKEVHGDTEIYSVEEIESLLNRLKEVRPEFLPFVAIGAFAGVRTEELLRMEWDNINFEQRFIEVPARKAKTAQRRHIPLQPNLAAWLEPYRNKEGKIWPLKKLHAPLRRVTAPDMEASDGGVVPGVRWKANALRHSYGSYRLPVLKSAAELALEMGNSPSMIFRHYRELVTPDDADKYWKIMPKADAVEAA